MGSGRTIYGKDCCCPGACVYTVAAQVAWEGLDSVALAGGLIQNICTVDNVFDLPGSAPGFCGENFVTTRSDPADAILCGVPADCDDGEHDPCDVCGCWLASPLGITGRRGGTFDYAFFWADLCDPAYPLGPPPPAAPIVYCPCDGADFPLGPLPTALTLTVRNDGHNPIGVYRMHGSAPPAVVNLTVLNAGVTGDFADVFFQQPTQTGGGYVQPADLRANDWLRVFCHTCCQNTQLCLAVTSATTTDPAAGTGTACLNGLQLTLNLVGTPNGLAGAWQSGTVELPRACVGTIYGGAESRRCLYLRAAVGCHSNGYDADLGNFRVTYTIALSLYEQTRPGVVTTLATLTHTSDPLPLDAACAGTAVSATVTPGWGVSSHLRGLLGDTIALSLTLLNPAFDPTISYEAGCAPGDAGDQDRCDCCANTCCFGIDNYLPPASLPCSIVLTRTCYDALHNPYSVTTTQAVTALYNTNPLNGNPCWLATVGLDDDNFLDVALDCADSPSTGAVVPVDADGNLLVDGDGNPTGTAAVVSAFDCATVTGSVTGDVAYTWLSRPGDPPGFPCQGVHVAATFG